MLQFLQYTTATQSNCYVCIGLLRPVVPRGLSYSEYKVRLQYLWARWGESLGLAGLEDELGKLELADGLAGSWEANELSQDERYHKARWGKAKTKADKAI